MEWRFRKLKKASTNVLTSRMDPLWEQCESVEFDVFKESNYINPSGRQRLDEFDRYQSSVFVAARDVNSEVAGAMRLVFNTSSDMQKSYFPTFNNVNIVERDFHDRGNGSEPGLADNGQALLIYREMFEKVMGLAAAQCMDVATMAIPSDKRDAKASCAMITRSIFFGWERSVRFALGAIDTRLYKKLRQRGLPFQDLGPSILYWGSPTTPAVLDMYKIPKGVWKLLIPIMRFKGKIRGAI